MYCEYRFNVSSSKKKRAVSNSGVQLNFQSFELEYEKYCLYDFIEIYDGNAIYCILKVQRLKSICTFEDNNSIVFIHRCITS